MERNQAAGSYTHGLDIGRSDEATDQAAHRTKMWILAGVLLSSFVAALDTTIVSTAMPRIIGDLQGMEYYAWPFTAYILCMATTIPIFGRMADIVGFKPIYFLGMLFFLAGSALCGVAQNMTQLIVCRGVQGIGGGMLTANSLGIIGATFAPAERAKYIGLGSAMMALASIVGPSLGGYITDHLTWRWVFYVNIPVGLAALTVILLTLPMVKERKARTIDLLGIVVFVLAVAPLLLALTWAGDEYAWTSAQIIGLFAFSLAMLVLFIYVERRAADPIVPMSYFRNAVFDVCSLGMLLSSGISIASAMFIPLFIQGVLGATATNSGMILTPLMLSLVIAAGVGGGIMTKTLKYKGLALAGFATMGIGVFLLSRIGIDTSRSTVVLYMIIVGAGMGLSLPVFSIAAQNAFAQSHVGAITSLVQFFRLLGATLFSAVLGSVLTTRSSEGLARVSFQGLPEQVAGFLRNPQAIASAEAIGELRARLPGPLAVVFDGALAQVRGVMADAIAGIFALCVVLVAAGLVVLLFLKEEPLRREVLKD